jgi:hypothetical protein
MNDMKNAWNLFSSVLFSSENNNNNSFTNLNINNSKNDNNSLLFDYSPFIEKEKEKETSIFPNVRMLNTLLRGCIKSGGNNEIPLVNFIINNCIDFGIENLNFFSPNNNNNNINKINNKKIKPNISTFEYLIHYYSIYLMIDNAWKLEGIMNSFLEKNKKLIKFENLKNQYPKTVNNKIISKKIISKNILYNNNDNNEEEEENDDENDNYIPISLSSSYSMLGLISCLLGFIYFYLFIFFIINNY